MLSALPLNTPMKSFETAAIIDVVLVVLNSLGILILMSDVSLAPRLGARARHHKTAMAGRNASTRTRRSNV
jgi:hypothetical protein